MLANRVRMGSRKKGKIEYIGEVYLAQDSDFVKVNGRWVYRGSELEIEIPYRIQGEKITSYAYMFRGLGDYLATPVTRVDSNNENVTNMSYMFYLSQATSLDLSSFDTSKVTDMSEMFQGAKATSLDVSSFDTSNVTDMSKMFRASKATSLDLSNFDTSNVTDMSSMFYLSPDTSLDVSSFDTSKVTDMSEMFQGAKATSLDLSSFDTSNVTNMMHMFNGSSATSLNLSNFDTSLVTNMSYMFRDSKVTSLDLSSFNTSNVTNMRYMFYNSQATSLDLSNFDTSLVTNMSYMFRSSKATSLDLSSFDTSNVTNMSSMFYLSQATSLDLSSFDTSKVTNMSNIFSQSQATTGYARTQTDAEKFNASYGIPPGLVFVPKGDHPPFGLTVGYPEDDSTMYEPNRHRIPWSISSRGKPDASIEYTYHFEIAWDSGNEAPWFTEVQDSYVSPAGSGVDSEMFFHMSYTWTGMRVTITAKSLAYPSTVLSETVYFMEP